MANDDKNIDLLMIGKTGNGKSALGNSILRRKAFKSMSLTSSVTTKVQYEVSEFNDRIIKVVDGPGVGDTRMDTEEATKLVMNAMSYAISANPDGYHAFLLVVKFGGRFTAEDQDTIAFLKKVFGETFVRNYCILVMTYGDNFEAVSEETGLTFQAWCRQQTGVFYELLMECNQRVILFDNRTKDEVKVVKQINDLIEMVDRLNFLGKRYKDEHFDKAKTARERVMIEAKKPLIRDETMRETSLIIQKIQRIQAGNEPEKCIADLEELHTRTELLHDGIKAQDKGTGALHDLVETVNSLMKTIADEIRFATRVAKEKEEMKRREAERKHEYEEEMHRQREQHAADARLQEQRRWEKEKIELERKWEKERNEFRRTTEEIERLYQDAKAKNEEGILDKVVSFITWPVRAIFG